MTPKHNEFHLLLLVIFSSVLLLNSCISIGGADPTIYRIVIPDSTVEVIPDSQDSQDFWPEMRKLHTQINQTQGDDPEMAEFAAALQNIMEGSPEKAVEALESLVKESGNEAMVRHAGELLSGIYMQSYDWESLIRLDAALPDGLDTLNTISMVKAWQTCPKEIIHYPDTALTLPIELSVSGVPMVSVTVNGVPRSFWIDTGAEFTVLSSDFAKKCGVAVLEGTDARVGTSTDDVIDLRAASVKRLEIGDLTIENHPVFIIPRQNLEVRLLKLFRILKIDGIIGWNAIQKISMEINYSGKTIQLSKPSSTGEVRDRNFHFITQPFVMVRDTTGIPLYFFLDTGANSTALYPPAYTAFDTTGVEKKHAHIGGAGGFQTVDQYRFRKQSLVLGSTRIDFPSLSGQPMLGDPTEGFIDYDGILGSDIAKKGRLILDFQNGRCELLPNNDK